MFYKYEICGVWLQAQLSELCKAVTSDDLFQASGSRLCLLPSLLSYQEAWAGFDAMAGEGLRPPPTFSGMGSEVERVWVFLSLFHSFWFLVIGFHLL